MSKVFSSLLSWFGDLWIATKSLFLTNHFMYLFSYEFILIYVFKYPCNALTRAEILTSNSVGRKSFFLGCNQEDNRGSNSITKKKICLVLPEKEISNHRN